MTYMFKCYTNSGHIIYREVVSDNFGAAAKAVFTNFPDTMQVELVGVRRA